MFGFEGNPTMSIYHWLITHDHIDGGASKGVQGPRGSTATAEEITASGLAFRLHDDDGELYYEGLYVGPDDESLFSPLDDFGMPNAGCTTIQYHNALGAWETI
jgi:hypothetical protein